MAAENATSNLPTPVLAVFEVKFENDSNGQSSNVPENKGDHYPYIVFDCETTGLDENKDRIVQLSMIKVLSKTKQEVFDEYINPQISRENQLNGFKIHKISPDILLKKKSFQFHAENILKFFNNVKYVFGHNVLFDWEFLTNAFMKLGINQQQGIPWIKLLKGLDIRLVDTYKMSIAAFPKLDRYRLVDVANHLGIESAKKQVVSYSVSSPKKKKLEPVKMVTGDGDGLHDAMMDVLVTNEIIVECMETLSKQSEDILNDSRYSYQIKNLDLIDKAINNTSDMTFDETESLKEVAKETMSSLRFTKGKYLKNLSGKELTNDIDFLKKRNGVADKRETKLRQTLLDLILS